MIHTNLVTFTLIKYFKTVDPIIQKSAKYITSNYLNS